jgi:nitrate/nitrite transporter NarK
MLGKARSAIEFYMTLGEKRQSEPWHLALLALLVVACVNGLTTTGITTFDESILKEFGGTRADLKLRDTVNFWGAALLLPVAGWLMDRGGARATSLVGLLLLAVAVFFYGRATSFLELYLLHGVFAMAIGLTGSLAMIVLVTRLFTANRGLAVGFALAGTSVGGMAMGQIMPRVLELVDWRTAFSYLAIVPVIMAALVYLLVPRTGTSESTVRQVDKDNSLPLSAAFKVKSFWLITLAGFLTFGTILAIFQNIFLHLRDLNFSPKQAGSGIALLSVCALTAKLASGFLSDRMGSKSLLLGSLAIMAVGLCLLASLQASLVWAAIGCIGFGWGGANTLINYIAIQVFGVAAAGRISGTISTAESIGAGIGPLAAATVFDATQSYGAAFLFMVALLVVSLAAIYFVRIPKIRSKPPPNT